MEHALRAAIERGTEPIFYRLGGVRLRTIDGRGICLHDHTGKPTPAGKLYWRLRGMEPPTYPLMQPMERDGTLVGFNGMRVKVCRKNGNITKAGLTYFRYHIPTVTVRLGVVRMRREDGRVFHDPRHVSIPVTGVAQEGKQWRRTTHEERGEEALQAARSRMDSEGAWSDRTGVCTGGWCTCSALYNEWWDKDVEPQAVGYSFPATDVGDNCNVLGRMLM